MNETDSERKRERESESESEQRRNWPKNVGQKEKSEVTDRFQSNYYHPSLSAVVVVVVVITLFSHGTDAFLGSMQCTTFVVCVCVRSGVRNDDCATTQ